MLNFTFEIQGHNGATDRLATPVGITHVISIASPGTVRPRGLDDFEPSGNVLRLEFHDTDLGPRPRLVVPSHDDVQKLIAFAGDLERGSHLMAHCMAGVSRSSAAVLICMATQLEPGPDSARLMVDLVRTSRPQARPNRRLLAIADRILGWNEALYEAGNALRT